jgi:hypothetical protein
MVGRKPPREWAWDRTARELFREFDKIRLSELYDHYQKGIAALEKNDLGGMRKAFDKVVRRSPNFEPRDQLVSGYLRFARERLGSDRDAAMQSAQRVLRLASDDSARNQALSTLLTGEAMALSERNLADRALLRRALELDGSNEYARKLLAELSREPIVESSTFMRVLWPSVLGALSLVFALLVGLRFVGGRLSGSSQRS